MSAKIIDGRAVAAKLRAAVKAEVARLAGSSVPGLAVVLVGDDPASAVYVRNKGKATVAAGMRSFECVLPATATLAEVLAQVAKLNADPAVHGILVQLPMPAHIDPGAVILAIDPAKDVDGLHPVNAGRLVGGLPGLVPCTPLGCLRLAREVHAKFAGLEAVVVGRSNLVGKPVAHLLLAEHCTVTIAHSRTRDLAAVTRRADILVAAAGRAEMIRGDWIKPGATVLDVGINRVMRPDGTARLIGDVAFDEAAAVAGAISPVPGGVGPMTIACLLANTLIAFAAQKGLPAPLL